MCSKTEITNSPRRQIANDAVGFDLSYINHMHNNIKLMYFFNVDRLKEAPILIRV